MGKINVLNKHIAELIAAGEVVERPSSVIKELVENSIDAGATTINIEIKNGGVTYMRITDNGIGIEKDDIKKAFLRNATSKIKVEDDLNNISTLGFRGEALFSICAVSKVELMTKTNGEEIGTHYKIEGGEEVLFEECGCSSGTTIIVRDLFYNTPARMKFLKKDSSEGTLIAKILDRIALSHPEVAFKFIREGKLELNTPGNGQVASAIYAVYGKEFFSSLMELEYKLNGVKLSGFINKPTSPRASRNMQHFFINGRYVKSRTAMVALEEAFKGSIMVQKFPACVMYIEIPFDSVDVNVHPSKVEIRFVDERPIFDAIYHGVKSALLRGNSSALLNERKIASNDNKKSVDNIHYSVENINSFEDKNLKNKNDIQAIKSVILNRDLNKESFSNMVEEITAEAPEIYLPKKSENVYAKKLVLDTDKDYNILNLEKSVLKSEKEDNIQKNVLDSNIAPQAKNKNDHYEVEKNVQLGFENKDDIDIKIKGEIFNTYIIVEKNTDEVVFIDKHAAHEKMIYKELKSSENAPLPQIFLEPVVVSLSKDEYTAIVDNISMFIKSGFEIDDFGNSSVVVRAAPSYLDNVSITDIITEMANYILDHKKNIQSNYVEWLYENIACRAAIKAGKEAKLEEMQVLIKRIIKEDPRFCPHGRPIAVTMKRREIEKMFGRA